MKKKNRRVVSVLLLAFLALMAVMTVVSRVMNESHIPEVETVSPASGNLKLSAIGCGVMEYGQLSDARLQPEIFTDDIFYVRGYFYDKNSLTGVAAGDVVWISIEGGNPVQGTLAAKMYDYREDVVEAVIFPENPQESGAYTVGAEVEFVLEDARMRSTCHIPNEVIYEEENGNYYIYVLKERESIAGNITIAVKTAIHIVAQNETRAALSDELELSTKIIKKDEVLKDGLKVREKEW